MPELAFFRHGEELLRVALDHRTAIGRDPGCDVTLPDPALSRVQVVVERRGDAWHLLDRSGRGTRVAGADVPEAVLTDGAEIALGTWRALFRSAASGASDDTRASGGTQLRAGEERVGPPPARLRVRAGGRERTVPVTSAGIVVGKDPTCDAPIDDAFVSTRHLRIEPQGSAWALVDLGSTNGTFISGARVVRAELPLGVPIQLGDAEIVLEPRETQEAPRAEAFEGMISRDPSMRQVFELMERVGASDAAVTILGETGTGKELVARGLHARSGRRDGPFIPVNCSAIAESLIESELFGHEKGAFSGAERTRKGAFEEADRGTIFLDDTFLERASPRSLVLRWSPEAMARLEAYDWPGNVRQLRNVVQRALLFRGEGLVVPPAAVTFEDTRTTPADTGDDDTMYVRGLTLEEIEREAIRLSLRRNRGKRAAVVKELQIAKSTVMKRIGQWGLQTEGRAVGAAPEPDDADDQSP